MNEQLVLCGGLSPRRGDRKVLQLDTSPNAPPEKRVELKLETLTQQLVDDLDPILRDAVEVAAYVLMADRLVRREARDMPHMGASWRRRLRFRIPVRMRAVWTASDVLECLSDALAFLSEDEIRIEFEQGHPAALLDPSLNFQEPGAQRIQPDDVILFSGGLDSLAGAVQQLVGLKRKAVLVTHKSSTNVAARQDALARSLEDRAPHQMFYAPVWVRKGDYEPVEHTQRTRSFLFVTLGVAVARMFGKDQVQFFENGITSFNLPIAEHVIGTRASRTTHPKVLASFSRLFSLLLQRSVSIENKFLWHTKADIVEVLRTNGCADLIGSATSCAQVRNLSMTAKQCGVCSQCIERRYAVLATELDGHDPGERYSHDLFYGPHSKPLDISLAEQHLCRAKRFAEMSQHAFLGAFGQVFRAIPVLPHGASQSATKVFELHQRYGREIVAVVESQLRSSAGLDRSLELPPTCLLAMIRSAGGIAIREEDPTEREPKASTQAAANRTPVKSRTFVFAVDKQAKKIRFAEGPVLTGASFNLVERLACQFQKDVSDKKTKASFEYVPTTTLMTDLGVSDHTLRQTTSRIRNALRKQFLRFTGYIIDDNDVIQSRKWKGYRLSPHLVAVPIAKLKEDDVTTR